MERARKFGILVTILTEENGKKLGAWYYKGAYHIMPLKHNTNIKILEGGK